MNVVFKSISALDDDLIELAAEKLTRYRKRRNAMKIVKYSVIAAAAIAACLALPFAVNKWSELLQGAPQPEETAPSAAVSGDNAAQTAAPDGEAARCTKLFDYFNVIKATLPEDRHLTFFEPDGLPEHVLKWDFENIWDVTGGEEKPLYSGMPVWSLYLADITGDGMNDLCSTVSIGSGIIDERVYVYDLAECALYELSDRGVTDYALIEMNGGLYYRAYDYPIGGDRNEFRIYPLKMSELVNTANYADEQEHDSGALLPEKIFDYGTKENVPETGEISFDIPELSALSFRYTSSGVSAAAGYGGETKELIGGTVISVYLADINNDGYREVCSVTDAGLGERVFVYDGHIKRLYKYYNNDGLIPRDINTHYEFNIKDAVLYLKSVSPVAELNEPLATDVLYTYDLNEYLPPIMYSFAYAEDALSQIPKDAAEVFCRAYYTAHDFAYTAGISRENWERALYSENGVTYRGTGYDYASFMLIVNETFTPDAGEEMLRIFPYFINRNGELYAAETVGDGAQETKTEFSVEELTDDKITLLRTVYYYDMQETRDVLTDVDYTHFTLYRTENGWRAGVFLQAVPEWYDPSEYKAAPPPLEMSDAQLREILADRGQKALEMYGFAYSGAVSEYGDKVYKLEDIGWNVYNLPDSWYFRTKDEMREYLKEYFIDETVSEYMSHVTNGSVSGELITREEKFPIISVDGELFVWTAGKGGPMAPNFESAVVESILGNEVTFRTEYVVEDTPDSYYTPGTYIFRGIMRYTDGRWKFIDRMTAELVLE